MEDGLSSLLNNSSLLNSLFILFLIMLSGFFIAFEFALNKVKEARLAELVSNGVKRAKLAQHVAAHRSEYVSASQFGLTLSLLAIGWLAMPLLVELLTPVLVYTQLAESLISPLAFVCSFGVMVFVYSVFGKLVPKAIAVNKAEGASLWLSGPLFLFYKITYPFMWFLNKAAQAIAYLFGVQADSEEASGHTEEEIRSLIKESQKSGHIDEDELTLVENIFEFSERVAREIMIPRTMFVCLYADASFEENLEIVRKHRHTRYPVVEKDKDNLLGLIHSTDMYNAALSTDERDKNIRSFIRPISFVPESMEISPVLKTMQLERIQMVAVVDEFDGTAGIITLEDIIEEIVGDIQDEIHEERAEVEILENRTSIDARMLIQEVNELFGFEIIDEDVDTVGGWIYNQLSEAPSVGRKVTFNDVVFEITEMEHLGIQRIEVHAFPLLEEDEEDAEGEAELEKTESKQSRAVS